VQKVLIYSVMLIAGLVLSQVYPALLGDSAPIARWWIEKATLICLAFIMIHVGLEFDIDKTNVRQYGWDYVVAMTAAAFPWLFCAAYFVFVMPQKGGAGELAEWKNALLLSRFSAPTSAGVLFTMLAAAGLAATWVFRKARILAIFDDIDTVLLMIPLKMLMVGLKWQLGVIVFVMGFMLWLAWRYLHAIHLSTRWVWVMVYSVVIVALCTGIYEGSKLIDAKVPIHLEVLLPAFVLGCMLVRPGHHAPSASAHSAPDHHARGHDDPAEARASGIIAAMFMVFVGLMMPPIQQALGSASGNVPWGTIALHVVIITVLSNVGKMFPALCYRREASLRERLAVAIGMWPRGEVGAGVLVISLSYGISGQPLVVAMLSLALNLVLTGAFITIVKRLLASGPVARPA
jgi:Kef-type K+ transport system membrane component KefB